MDISTMNHTQLTQLGSVFRVMLTMHFTVQLLSQHLLYWKNLKEHKAIVIIILMAPIYAIVSFVGLLDIKGSKEFFMLLESVKECYEAFFLALIYSYLNISISKNIVPNGINGREIHHSFPMTLFQPADWDDKEYIDDPNDVKPEVGLMTLDEFTLLGAGRGPTLEVYQLPYDTSP